jgi:hypothetical protein
MTPSTLIIDPWVEGDTWDGLPGIKIKTGADLETAGPPATSLDSVVMRFSLGDEVNSSSVEISSEDDQILIEDEDAWLFSVPSQIIPELTEGKWRWQIRCTSGTLVKTYLQGEIEIGKKI